MARPAGAGAIAVAVAVMVMNAVAIVALDAATWAGWSYVVGTVAARRPDAAFARDSFVTRLRPWERDGRVYEHLAIKRWKDAVPELGRHAGGRSKRTLPGRDATALQRFAAETRRAEYVHWAIPCALPVFALWNPIALFGAMAAYAVLANLPFVAIQRYNRGRVLRILGTPARNAVR